MKLHRKMTFAAAMAAAGLLAVTATPAGAMTEPASRPVAVTMAGGVSLAPVPFGDVTLDVVGGTTVVYTIPEDVFRSTTRTILRINGSYQSSSYGGRAYYSTVQVVDGVATVRTQVATEPQQKIEIFQKVGASGAEQSVALAYMPGSGSSMEVQADHSRMTAIARGDGKVDQWRENRTYRHNTLEPVGRYIRAGEQIVVALPHGAPDTTVVIGQWGAHSGVNGGASTGQVGFAVSAGLSTVTAPIDGLVYLNNTNDSGSIRAAVTGGVAVPTFKLGETTEAQFQDQMSRYTGSQFTIIEGERVVAALQRSVVEPNIAAVTAERVAYWDDVVATTDEVYGLSVNDTGLHRKSPARIYIANPDGGGVNASTNRISFGINSAVKLLNRGIEAQWGLWHEIGHTYQTPQYKWAGLSEVTVNISALAIQAQNGWPSNLDPYRASIDAYLAMPDADKDFDAITSGWIKLAMFDGLREQFGDTFYPTLNRIYREQVAAGDLSLPTTDAQQQHFMVTAGQASGRNLTEYFVNWGLHPSPATLTALAAYPY